MVIFHWLGTHKLLGLKGTEYGLHLSVRGMSVITSTYSSLVNTVCFEQVGIVVANARLGFQLIGLQTFRARVGEVEAVRILWTLNKVAQREEG